MGTGLAVVESTLGPDECHFNVALRAPYGKELDSRLTGSPLMLGFRARGA
jgi:hypothetical protein